MTYPSDDLAPLLAEEPEPAARYSQGVIRAWDPATFENTIEWRGTLLQDVPVLSGADALTYQVGDVVSLRGVGTGGTSTWAIDGRLITPGPGAGARTVGWMTTALARDLAAAVFADRIYTATVAASQSTTSTSWTNLATVGPTVSDVPITSGKAIVLLSATVTAINETAHMSIAVSGATSVAPDYSRALSVDSSNYLTATRAVVLTGLTPGMHTFQARYATNNGIQVWISQRALVVIAL